MGLIFLALIMYALHNTLAYRIVQLASSSSQLMLNYKVLTPVTSCYGIVSFGTTKSDPSFSLIH